jgi:hypothetical protein
MGWRELVRETWDLVPIFLLLVVGGAIAIQSGHAGMGERRDFRQLAQNLSQIVFRLVGYMTVLTLIQYCIGLRPMLGW